MVSKRIFGILVGLCLIGTSQPVSAQDIIDKDGGDNIAASREAMIADKFMQVLLRRPAPGTALDRVYGYHVQAGSLDATLDGLKSDVDEGGDDAGAKAMLLGLLQLHRGADAAAAESLAQAEKLRPDDAMVSYHLGKALLLVGRGEAAAKALERSIDRKPARNQALPVFTELGRLYGRSQQNEKALAVWNRLEETFPGDTRVGEQIAQTLAEEGQNEAALERYVALAKKSASAGDAKGIGYQIAAAELKRRVGDADEALADFEAILSRLRPSSWLHSDVQRRIEAGFLRSGDYAALADYYAAQVRSQPDALELRMRLGQVQSKAGLLADAEETLTETVKLAPSETEPRLALVDLYQGTAKYTEAAEQLRILVEQDTENPDYLIRLGNTILEDTSINKDARKAGAAEAWQQLADARKDDAVITAQVGDLMRRIGRNDDAIAMYEQAVVLAPDQAQYREYLGEFLNRLDRKDEAMVAWNSIAEEKRATRDNFIRLAEVLNTFDHPEEALSAFAKAAEMDPTFAHRLRYTELLARAEKYDEALSQLDSAESSAETPEEREQLLRSRIGVYAGSGELEQRTVEASAKAESSGTADDYRRLALMLDASAATDDALVAIQSAMKADESDIASMEIAAELYRKSSRSADAITIYRRLAEVDVRFLPNYLKRIATLHMELGQVERALAAADELIQAGPGNPESYRFYAEQCFRVGRDDEGIERLRRALRAAPRDRDARRALASALDDRFRTDEAIELYWALLEDNDDLSEQRGLTKSLASLYGRKGDFDRLLGRLELRGRESSDMRTATLLISEAHRAMDDFGSASAALEPLLAENTRDAELITQLVDLSQAADDLETALQYQVQLTKLADTPENRNRELKLLIDSGQMERAEATLVRMQSVTDPLALIDIIDRSLSRKEAGSVVRFSRLALEKEPGLWEVRPRLVAGLIEDEEYDEALAEIETILAINLPNETISEKGKDMIEKAKARGQLSSSQLFNSSAKTEDTSAWYGYASGMSALARYHQLGRYSRMTFSSSRSSAVDPRSLMHAKVFAEAYRMVIASKQNKLDEFVEAEGLKDLDDILSIDDPERLKRLYLFASLKPSMDSRSTSTMAPKLEALTWQMIQQIPAFRSSMVYRMLSSRASMRTRQNRPGVPKVEIKPLADEQIQLIREMVADQDVEDLSSDNVTTYTMAFWYQELKELGKDEEAASVRDLFEISTDTIKDAIFALSTTRRFQDFETNADLLVQIREKLPIWASAMTSSEASGLSRLLVQMISMPDLDEATQLTISEMGIALQTIASKGARRSRRASSATGVVNTHYNATGTYQQLNLQVPLAAERLPSSLVTTLAQAGFASPDSELATKAIDRWKNGDLILADKPQLAQAERELRDVLVAYSNWWTGDVEATYDAVVELSEADPEDNDWWIERARLAAELKMPEASLEALDSINPMDQATLQIRELAAMNLASQLGDLDRAKTAAQRLFGMRLDSNTELALSDQLTRLGMREMAAAVLQRSRRRGGQSVSDLLSLADRYAKAGDKDAAAEIAYSAMRRLNRGGERNEDYYRRRAVEKLRLGGRLDAIVRTAEKRVASSPSSLSSKFELAQLYTAAGRKDDADKVFAKIAELQPDDPKTLWATAKRLYSAGKYDKATIKFATAAVKDPKLLDRGYNDMTNSLRRCKNREPAYEVLMDLDLSAFRGYVAGRLVDANSGRPTDKKDGNFQKAFLAKVLKECSVEDLDDIMRAVVRNENFIKSEPVADAVRRIFTSDQTFDPQDPVWQRGSYGSDGRFYGIIEPCMEVIAKNEKLRDEMQETLRKRIETDKAKDTELGSPITEMMLVATQIGNTPEENFRPTLNRLLKLDNTKVPYQAWWQIGQLLEKNEDLASLTVEVYEKGVQVAEGNSQMREYQYSMNPRLADAYVAAGMKKKAREKLLEAYANTDNSADNQHNPGYGDYQDMRSFLEIAKKLVASGCRLEAIPIYADGLSKPERFVSAKRWGGSTRYEQQFKDALKDTIKDLSDADHAEYLTLPLIQDASTTAKKTDDTKTKKEKLWTRFSLLPMTPTTEIEPNQSSVAAIVTSTLSESETGRELMTDFDAKLAERLVQTPDEISLVAMRALIATFVQPDTANEHFDRLAELVPEVDPSERITRADASVLAMYSPALVGMATDDPKVRTAAANLSDRLIALADASERKAISEALVLSKIRHLDDDPTSVEGKLSMLNAMLDRAAKTTAPPKVLSTEAADDCIRIAETAVAAEAWTVVVDAIGRAFGGGPPLRKMGNDTGATFLLQASQNTSNEDSNENKLDALTKRMHKVLDKVTPQFETDSNLAEHAYQTLAGIMMPTRREQEIFLYATDVVRSSVPNPNNRSDGEPKLNSPSVAASLAEAAKACGKVDDLKSRLADRRMKVQSKGLVDWVAFQVAWAGEDQDQSEKAFIELGTTMGVVFKEKNEDPREDQETDGQNEGENSVQKPTSKSPSNASLNNQSSARLLLNASIAMYEREGVTPIVQSVWRHLLKLNTTDTTLVQVPENWHWIIVEVIGNADNDDSVVADFVGLYQRCIGQFYSHRNQYGLVEQRTAYALGNIVKPAIQSGRLLLAAKWSRPMMIEAKRQGKGSGQNFSSVQIADEDAKARFEYLSYILLGEPDQEVVEEGLVPMVGYPVYAEPPAVLADAAKLLTKARKTHFAAEDFPLDSIGLALSIAAAECQQTDALITRFSEYVSEPGDEADAMVGLALLSADRNEEAGEVLTRVAKRLKDTVPKKKTDKPLPHESAILIVRAFEVDSLRETAKAAFQSVMHHVHNTNLGNKTGYYNKTMTRIVDSFASATTTDLKLDHFIGYQTPYPDVPVTEMNKPKWASDDGSVLYGGGTGANMMILRYPLAGEFTFELVQRPRPWGGLAVTANGASFAAQAYNNSAVVKGLVGRGEVKRDIEGIEKGKPVTMKLIHADDEVVFRAAGQDLMTDARVDSFPFVGLFLQSYSTSEATDISITGNPTIPRQVNLMHPRLRGWSSQIVGVRLPALHLPIMPKQDAEKLATQRRDASKLDIEYAAWLVTDDELRTGKGNTNTEKHLHYQRPILDGETVSYKFWYEPEKMNVSPTVGRVVMMIRKDSVKLRWMPQSSSAESDTTSRRDSTSTLKTDFEVDDVLGDGKPNLKAGDWNAVELAADGDKVTITINGQPLARVTMALDRRPGFLCEAKREVRVRDISLSGDWPETLPDDLFSK